MALKKKSSFSFSEFVSEWYYLIQIYHITFCFQLVPYGFCSFLPSFVLIIYLLLFHFILLIGCFNIHLCLFFSGCGHPAEVGWTPTPNLVQIPRLRTLLKPREFERKFITHTGDPWEELGGHKQVQAGLGTAERAL